MHRLSVLEVLHCVVGAPEELVDTGTADEGTAEVLLSLERKIALALRLHHLPLRIARSRAEAE